MINAVFSQIIFPYPSNSDFLVEILETFGKQVRIQTHTA